MDAEKIAAGLTEGGAWAAMDAWCHAKIDEIGIEVEARVYASRPFDSEHYRQIGQSQALHRMRSFIHGSRQVLSRGEG